MFSRRYFIIFPPSFCKGAIQGPSEFAEGVLLGVRSLFGHTVGGAAGAVGRITGAMGVKNKMVFGSALFRYIASLLHFFFFFCT